MSTSIQLLQDAFGRIQESASDAVDGLSQDDLARRLDGDANSIAWLVWHLTRVQDDHIADLAGAEQAWMKNGWFEKFGLPFDASEHGYGHTSDDVAKVRVEGDLLLGYLADVHKATLGYLARLDESEMDKVIDDSWSPPVTVGIRLISVVSDDLQHAGQAAFIRGVSERAR
jgi:hypothetical protein